MDLETADNTTEIIEEVKSVEEIENSDLQIPSPDADYKEKQGFFGRMADKFFKKTTADDSVDEEDVEDSEAGEEETTQFEITDEIRQAAEAAGWDDEKINKYAKEDPEVLTTLVKLYDVEDLPSFSEKNAVVPEPEEKKPVLEKQTFNDDDFAALKEQYGDEVVDKIISPLADKLNKVIDVVNAQAESGQAVQQAVNSVVEAEREKMFQQQLDMLDEKFPVFGKWENVPRDAKGQIDVSSPQFKARAEVWMGAKALANAGFEWDRALESSILMYKGKHLESLIKSQVVKDLNAKKKEFSPRPTSKKIKPVKLEGKAAAIKALEDAARQAGVELT